MAMKDSVAAETYPSMGRTSRRGRIEGCRRLPPSPHLSCWEDGTSDVGGRGILVIERPELRAGWRGQCC